MQFRINFKTMRKLGWKTMGCYHGYMQGKHTGFKHFVICKKGWDQKKHWQPVWGKPTSLRKEE